ncbi:hypothetical protein [Homoserinibacter sp. GY 40078]|uniref:hypothetical protein n=1 Tax=Homoserinibacter sp. GY 40078 TaxID=2603275 RepID=UPI0011CAEB86|nr:hypothetical protein [Homoserinibacter sp. GY 40078]TXK19119.1 hypothetical protein FVQ89_04135 [Homoserinibacter sp. GY 40078]
MFWLQMEGEPRPPSGDERLSDRADHLTAHGESRGVADDDFRPDDVTDWSHVREIMRLARERDGVPVTLDDLSVDEFTERRIAKSDFAGVIKIWRRPEGAGFHPGIKREIELALNGRNPDVDVTSDPLTIQMNVADDSFETRWQVEFFGLHLALMLDGLPRVVVGRYRNFDSEDAKDK